MAESRRYSAALESLLVSGTVDLIELVPHVATTVEILEFHISQYTLVGDANSEMISISVITDHTTAGDHTPGIPEIVTVPLATGDNLFSGEIYRNLNTVASGGTPKIVYRWNFLNRIAFSHIFTPETNRIVSPGQRIVFRMDAPTTPMIISFYLFFQELGGVKKIFGTVNQVSETDTAFKLAYVALASETDTAFSVTPSKV